MRRRRSLAAIALLASSAIAAATETVAPTEASPSAPTHLTARALSPFQIRLEWQDAADENGYEIQTSSGGDFVRVKLVDRDVTASVVHGREPDTEVRFRIRAFNSTGISAPSTEVRVRTLPLAESPRQEAVLSPCTTREAALAYHTKMAAEEGITRLPEVQLIGGDLGLETISDPGSCGQAICGREYYGQYRGCYRLLGRFDGWGAAIVASAPSSTPLVVNFSGTGAMESSALLLQFANGTLVEVDYYQLCEDDGRPLIKLTPPFSDCHRDLREGPVQTITPK